MDKENDKRGLGEIHGETWKVESSSPLRAKEEMIVSNFEGLKLKVRSQFLKKD